LDIANGTASDFHGHKNIMPTEYRGICDMIKIPNRGWKNVNLLGLFGILFATGFVWAIGWKHETGLPPPNDKRLNLVFIWHNILEKPVLWVWDTYLEDLLWSIWICLKISFWWCMPKTAPSHYYFQL
jgi:hypothetical protein